MGARYLLDIHDKPASRMSAAAVRLSASCRNCTCTYNTLGTTHPMTWHLHVYMQQAVLSMTKESSVLIYVSTVYAEMLAMPPTLLYSALW